MIFVQFAHFIFNLFIFNCIIYLIRYIVNTFFEIFFSKLKDFLKIIFIFGFKKGFGISKAFFTFDII